jgi:hypothetical protein
MTSALQCRHQHSYRLSAYERKANDFYPTPSDVAVGLALGLPRLGLDLPRGALDPCGGDGALRRSLAPFGVDVRLSDLYPDKYSGVDGYVTSQSLDASDPELLTNSLELAGSDCTAIVTNSPHRTDEACAIVSNLIFLVEGQHVDFVAAPVSGNLGRQSSWLSVPQPAVMLRRNPLLSAPSVDRREFREARCTLTRGTSGEKSHGTPHL